MDIARILEKIRKLLKLAEGTDGPEADAALASARRLMDEYDIDQATVTREELDRGYVTQLFERVSRVTGLEHALSAVLTQCFHVELIHDRQHSAIHIFGQPHRIKFAGYVYVVLHRKFREKCEATRPVDRDSYFLGMAATVIRNLRRDEVDPTGLIVADQERKQALQSTYELDPPGKLSVTKRSFAAGEVDGRDIRIDKPLGHTPAPTAGRLSCR